MTLMLTPDQLDAGFEAIEKHGYSMFFPDPPEWDVVANNWPKFRGVIASYDLDTYRCYEPLITYAPKSQLNIRAVTLLHPVDLLIYTSLVMAFRDDINSHRLSAKTRRVFSFRSDNSPIGVLYNPKPNFSDFRNRIREKARSNPNAFVALSDISDFYPNIYQHRLVNALDAASGGSKRDLVRVFEKLLTGISRGTSYGVPVGPYASRLLGEAILIDIDAALRSEQIDFYRYVDDFVIFTKTPEEAEAALFFLGEHLHRNHGHTLQTSKTSVMRATEYVKQKHTLHSSNEKKRRELLQLLIAEGDYEPKKYDDLTKSQRDKLDAMNLSQMLDDALKPGRTVDFTEVKFIISRLSALEKPELIPLVLDNIERLYPLSGAVAMFLSRFTQLPDTEQRRIANALLRPLLRRRGVKPPDYYGMWMLSLFHENPVWNHADQLLQIYNGTSSPVIRRYAALALASSGTRAQVVQFKDQFRAAHPLLKTALLFASQRMGVDERKFWRTSLAITDTLEREI